MRSLSAALLLLPFAAAGLPQNALGQAPGYTQIDTRTIFAEYHAEVISDLNDLMAKWGTAWANDNLDDLTNLYWENAVMVPPQGGVPARGQEAIKSWLGEHLPEYGGMEAFMLDFDASGGMAVIYGNYLLQQPGNAATLASGPMVTVYLLRGKRWKIRSQIFTAN